MNLVAQPCGEAFGKSLHHGRNCVDVVPERVDEQKKVREVDALAVIEKSRCLQYPVGFAPAAVADIKSQFVAVVSLKFVEARAHIAYGLTHFVGQRDCECLSLPVSIKLIGNQQIFGRRGRRKPRREKHFEKVALAVDTVGNHAHHKSIP